MQHKPGKYIVAVSGGVDSMALLDLLTRIPNLQLVVAHFDHGIREDSPEDAKLVETAAQQYKLPFTLERGNLGSKASEATARAARYAFLRQAAQAHGAHGIVTAHHQDDVLETALLNLLRGTGRRGLSSLRSRDDIVRPLLNVTKEQLQQYAKARGLQWREDSTNHSDRYQRNYIRRHIVPAMSPTQRAQLLEAIRTAAEVNDDIDALLHGQVQGESISRQWFIMLPHNISCEVMAAWLRRRHLPFDRQTIERLTVFAKTAQPGKRADVGQGNMIHAGKEHITLFVKSPKP